MKQNINDKKKNKQTPSEPIAVIGLGCWYPDARNPKELWENILARRQQFRQLPDCRLPISDYYSPDKTIPDKTYGDRAALIDGHIFDWAGKKITKFAYESTDIVHWLALDITLDALNDAGYDLDSIRNRRTGAIIGNTVTGEVTRSNTMRLRWPYVRKVFETLAKAKGWPDQEIQNWQSEMEIIYKSVFAPITEDTLAGGLSNTIAGRICNYLDIHGGGYTVDGACSSSLLAIITAATMLNSNDLDVAIAGGVDISLDTFELIGFAKTLALTANDMNVYDQAGSGFIPGEGCGTVILKRLDDAIRDENKIYAVMRGWGISSDGKGSITAPSAIGQSLSLIRAYKRAGYEPHTLDFIEGHGTGTTVGDRVELTGIGTTFEHFGDITNRQCGVTSLKSLIGHTKAAAGVGAFIKTVMSLNQRVLPPTAGCMNPHDVFNESIGKPLFPILHGEQRDITKQMRAGVSAMGFGGINSHVTLESYDKPFEHLKPALSEEALFVSNQDTECYVFSADTKEDLISTLNSFQAKAQGISICECADLAYNNNLPSDVRLPLRAGIIASSPKQILERLELLINNLEKLEVRNPKSEANWIINQDHQGIWISFRAKANKIGFLFPGQGSQHLNMCQILYHRFDWAKDMARKFDGQLQKAGYNGVLANMFKQLEHARDKDQISEWEKAISKTGIAQPAIVLSSLIWQENLKRLGIEPYLVAGHSLGELSAFYAAGAVTLEELIQLVGLRAKTMGETHQTGQMASLNCNVERAVQLTQSLPNDVVIANINSPKQTVVSGTSKGIHKVLELAQKHDIISKQLPVSNAFHSPLVAEAAKIMFTEGKLSSPVNRFKTKLYSSVTGNKVQQNIDLKYYFSDQIIKPVKFLKLIENIQRECDVLIEVGPGRVLTGLVEKINANNLKGFCCEEKAESSQGFNKLLINLFIRGKEINWNQAYQNRLIKPFIRAKDKTFFVNPLERPLKTAEGIQYEQSSFNGLAFLNHLQAPRDQVLQCLNTKGGFISKIIDEYIKASQHLFQKEFSPIQVNDGNSVQRSISEAKRFREGNTATQNIKTVNPDPNQNLGELLLSIASKRTGFDKESISLDHRLLDDLNLDSIKSAELVAEATRTMGIRGAFDASQFANSTLKDIENEINVYLSQKQFTKTEDQINREVVIKSPTWVRPFIMKAVEAPLETISDNYTEPLKDKLIYILYENGSDAKANQLQSLCRQNEINCHSIPVEKVNNEIGKQASHIIVLPSDVSYDLAQFSIRKSIDILQKSGSSDYSNWETLTFIHSGREINSFAASIHLERSNIKVRSIDIPKSSSINKVFEIYCQEISQLNKFIAVKYSANLKRSIFRPFVQNPAGYEGRDIKWTSKDVILVTGGAKGITAECIIEWSKHNKVSLALLGRTELPRQKSEVRSQETNDSDIESSNNTERQDKEIENTFARLTTNGCKFKYYSCNITNITAVRNTIQKVQSDLGSITGIIHGAGANKPMRAEQASLDQAIEEVSPKLQGIQNILTTLKRQPLKLIAAFSSIIGVTGMPGNAWYAWSNETLERLLSTYKEVYKDTHIFTLAYSVWDEVGMGARMGSINQLAALGIGAISKAEGVRRFIQLMKFDLGCQQVVIAARLGGLDTWQPIFPEKPEASRFLEEIIAIEPNVEVIAKAHLSLEDDFYLLDHKFKGSYLFPTVFGIEAMGQAVAYVTGRQEFGNPLKIENIQLEKPIVVDLERGLDIQIRAVRIERPEVRRAISGEDDRDARIAVGISTEQSDFQTDHFSAEFVLDIQAAPQIADFSLPAKALDTDPKKHLYGVVLWQGERFQRMQKMYSLNDKEALFSSAYREVEQNAKLTFSNNKPASLILGDPYLRDTMLQSIQISIPKDQSLPLRINEMFVSNVNNNGNRFIKSKINKLEDDIYHCTILNVNEEKRILEKCTDYQLKIVSRNPNMPSAAELADNEWQLNYTLQKEIKKISSSSESDTPLLMMTSLGKSSSLTTNGRRKIEKQFFQRALTEYLTGLHHEVDREQICLEWNQEGKPFSSGLDSLDLAVSFSHKDDYLLIALGTNPQGCDIETVRERSFSEWIDILGGKNRKILEELIQQDISLNKAGTIIWSSIEAYKKANGMSADYKIKFADIRNNHIFLSIFYQEDIFETVSFQIQSTHIITFCRKGIRQGIIDQDKDICSYTGVGPQGQQMYVERNRLSFDDVYTNSGIIKIFNFPYWLGKLRENALSPIMDLFRKDLASGKWGFVTNNSKFSIYGVASAFDVVEGRVWLSNVKGLNKSTIELHAEWRRLNKKEPERIATGCLETSWVKIKGHGIVESRPLPPYSTTLFNKMLPKYENNNQYGNLPFQFNHGIKKNIVLNLENSIGNRDILDKQSFTSCINESNLVGNIYFANYYKWQNAIISKLLYNIYPEYISSTNTNEQFISISASINHLREAMPYDIINEIVYIQTILSDKIVFKTEFHKQDSDTDIKLAIGEQHIAFYDFKTGLTQFPEKVLDRLMTKSNL